MIPRAATELQHYPDLGPCALTVLPSCTADAIENSLYCWCSTVQPHQSLSTGTIEDATKVHDSFGNYRNHRITLILSHLILCSARRENNKRVLAWFEYQIRLSCTLTKFHCRPSCVTFDTGEMVHAQGPFQQLISVPYFAGPSCCTPRMNNAFAWSMRATQLFSLIVQTSTAMLIELI